MTEPFAPPPPPVGFTYDGTPDALAKIEHLVGRKRMQMAEIAVDITQMNMRTMQRETAKLPKPDPSTLYIENGPENWIYVPLGARIEHWGEDVTLIINLGPAVHPIEMGEVRQ